MRWTVHLQGGPTRVNHAACRIADKIFCFGGYSSSFEGYKDWDPIPVHELNTVTLRWKKIPPSSDFPCQRYGHTTIAYNKMVYMWGGRNNSEAWVPLCMFDTRILRWSNPPVQGAIPYAKDGHSACLVDNNMYIFGGFEYISDSLTNEIHCLNLDTYMWHIVNPSGPPPTPRDFHTAVSIGKKMYIYGGRSDLSRIDIDKDEEEYCPLLYVYDTVGNHWSLVKTDGELPVGRRSHSAWEYKGDLYVFGGYNSLTRQHYNCLHKYSVTNNQWSELIIPGKTPCKRRRQVCVRYNDNVYLFGGTSPVNPDAAIRHQEEPLLFDKSDLHILDYCPTLRTMAIMAIIDNNLLHRNILNILPKQIRIDVLTMSLHNKISKVDPVFGWVC